jgi:hypothetical protein
MQVSIFFSTLQDSKGDAFSKTGGGSYKLVYVPPVFCSLLRYFGGFGLFLDSLR